MIVIRDTIVSEDVVDIKFCCNLAACKGACCVEGDGGAPLEEEEISELIDCYQKVKPYMTEKGIKAVEEIGVYDYDEDGDLATPLVDGQECAFVNYENGITYCAIEKAYREGKINFHKPISCYLYPIRVDKLKAYSAVNYHKWSICKPALKNGKSLGLPIYKFLKDPLIRKFGEDWYNELCEEIDSGRYDEVLNRE